MHTHQYWSSRFLNIPADESDVAFGVNRAFIRNETELTVVCSQHGFSYAVDKALRLHAVTDDLRYGDHAQAMHSAELDQVRHTGHGAVIAHDLADHPSRDESGHAGEVHASFGLSGADERATFARAQRESVPGAIEVAGRRCRIDQNFNRA